MHFDKLMKLPEMAVQVQSEFPFEFTFGQAWTSSVLHRSRYSTYVRTSFEPSELSLPDAVAGLFMTLAQVTHETKKQGGEELVAATTRLKNALSYE